MDVCERRGGAADQPPRRTGDRVRRAVHVDLPLEVWPVRGEAVPSVVLGTASLLRISSGSVSFMIGPCVDHPAAAGRAEITTRPGEHAIPPRGRSQASDPGWMPDSMVWTTGAGAFAGVLQAWPPRSDLFEQAGRGMLAVEPVVESRFELFELPRAMTQLGNMVVHGHHGGGGRAGPVGAFGDTGGEIYRRGAHWS